MDLSWKWKFEVSIDIPGVKPEDVEITLEERGTVLSVSGHREHRTNKGHTFVSKFSKSFSLDHAVDTEKIKATMEQGVLKVSAPKDAKKLQLSSRTIPINTTADEAQGKEVPQTTKTGTMPTLITNPSASKQSRTRSSCVGSSHRG